MNGSSGSIFSAGMIMFCSAVSNFLLCQYAFSILNKCLNEKDPV